MNFLQKLEQTSLSKILAVTFFAGIVLATPVTVWVAQRQTQLAGRAMFEKPEVVKPVKIVGAPSEGEPKIDLVWPFLGKMGDAVLIEGQNLGNNPQDKKLFVANQLVAEEKIERWTEELIEFLVPEGAVSGNIHLEVGGKKAFYPYFFTVYGLETKVQASESSDIVRVINAPLEGKLEIFFSDGQKMESDQLEGVRVPADKTIISILLKNKAGSPVSFFVEPEEFGF